MKRIKFFFARVCAGIILSYALVISAHGALLPDKQEAKAYLHNRQGEIVGAVFLKEMEDGVHFNIKIDNLPPGLHAFHIHETGKCEPPDFKSSGGHFNPFGKEHGFLNPKGPHAGDMANIPVGRNGTLDTELIAKDVTLKKGVKNSLFKKGGTAIVIHKGADDYTSDPAGAAGPRIACGVIE